MFTFIFTCLLFACLFFFFVFVLFLWFVWNSYFIFCLLFDCDHNLCILLFLVHWREKSQKCFCICQKQIYIWQIWSSFNDANLAMFWIVVSFVIFDLIDKLVKFIFFFIFFLELYFLNGIFSNIEIQCVETYIHCLNEKCFCFAVLLYCFVQWYVRCLILIQRVHQDINNGSPVFWSVTIDCAFFSFYVLNSINGSVVVCMFGQY